MNLRKPIFSSKQQQDYASPFCFPFPGLGGQWFLRMAKALMPIEIFANKIEESLNQIFRLS